MNAALQLECPDCKDCTELKLSLRMAIFEKCCVLIQSSDACMAISSQVNIVTCGGSLSDFEYMGLSDWSSYATNAAPERFFSVSLLPSVYIRMWFL